MIPELVTVGSLQLNMSVLVVFGPSQGKYEEADLLFTRSLAIDEKAHGLDHPEIASNLDAWASLLMLQVRAVGIFQ